MGDGEAGNCLSCHSSTSPYKQATKTLEAPTWMSQDHHVENDITDVQEVQQFNSKLHITLCSRPTFVVEAHGNYTQLNRLMKMMMIRTSAAMCNNSRTSVYFILTT